MKVIADNFLGGLDVPTSPIPRKRSPQNIYNKFQNVGYKLLRALQELHICYIIFYEYSFRAGVAGVAGIWT
jgi:hypothetical protein